MFELWIDEAPIKGGGFVLATSKCFARRTLEEVRSEFHDMKVGDIFQGGYSSNYTERRSLFKRICLRRRPTI